MKEITLFLLVLGQKKRVYNNFRFLIFIYILHTGIALLQKIYITKFSYKFIINPLVYTFLNVNTCLVFTVKTNYESKINGMCQVHNFFQQAGIVYIFSRNLKFNFKLNMIIDHNFTSLQLTKK